MKLFLIPFISILLVSCTPKKAERFVQVNDTKIHIKEFGTGEPTIIFENGMSSPLGIWKAIPDSIAKEYHIFAYDRAGIGKSEETKVPRKVPNMVLELREVLKKENIRPPYIYVAHSMGSYLARYFAMTYPDELKGVLLIDPSPDLLYDSYSEKEYLEFQKMGNESFANSTQGERLEWESYLENRKYVQSAPFPENVPLIIVSATQWDFYDFHAKIMNKNKYSRHLKVNGSHDIHQEQPELMIELIRELSSRVVE